MCTHAHMRVAGMNTFPRTPTASLHASAWGQDAVTLLLPVLTRLASPNPTSRPGPLNTRASGHTDGQPTARASLAEAGQTKSQMPR